MVKLKVEQLRNIPIQQLVYSGSWTRIIANTKIELKHVGDGIILLVNNVLQPMRWQVYERGIAGDITSVVVTFQKTRRGFTTCMVAMDIVIDTCVSCPCPAETFG
jgi:hypothetical protein